MERPVVGWLVVVEGTGKGSALPLTYGQNSVGRSPDGQCAAGFQPGADPSGGYPGRERRRSQDLPERKMEHSRRSLRSEGISLQFNIVYDGRDTKKFYIGLSSEAGTLTYIKTPGNDKLVMTIVELDPFTRIIAGDTELMFVPLCRPQTDGDRGFRLAGLSGVNADPAIACGSSHQGARDYQEDRFEVVALNRDGRTLLIICDGMGGHAHGAEAAQSALDAFVGNMLHESDRAFTGQLKRSLDLANKAVARRAQAHAGMQGMGCTLAAALIDGDRVYWVSVGDSPIWLVRGRKMERLNEDHSVGGYNKSLVEKGEMSAEDARERGGFNELRSAVMGQPIEITDLCGGGDGITLKAGDAILAASDGVLTLSEPEIAARIRGLDARQAAQGLIGQVIAAGRPRQDNVTVALSGTAGPPDLAKNRRSRTGAGPQRAGEQGLRCSPW